MTPAWIVRTLERYGVTLHVHAGNLIIDAPVGVLKPLDRAILKERAHDLLAYVMADRA